jgi:hypothetical protein
MKRPTLRNHTGQYEGHEWGEHPEREEHQQDSGIVMTTCMEHQRDRAHGTSQHHDQGCGAQEAKEPPLRSDYVHWGFDHEASCIFADKSTFQIVQRSQAVLGKPPHP